MKPDEFERLSTAIRSISHGGVEGPTGLEALAMSIGGEGPYKSGLAGEIAALGTAVRECGQEIRYGLEAIAAAIRAH